MREGQRRYGDGEQLSEGRRGGGSGGGGLALALSLSSIACPHLTLSLPCTPLLLLLLIGPILVVLVVEVVECERFGVYEEGGAGVALRLVGEGGGGDAEGEAVGGR